MDGGSRMQPPGGAQFSIVKRLSPDTEAVHTQREEVAKQLFIGRAGRDLDGGLTPFGEAKPAMNVLEQVMKPIGAQQRRRSAAQIQRLDRQSEKIWRNPFRLDKPREQLRFAPQALNVAIINGRRRHL